MKTKIIRVVGALIVKDERVLLAMRARGNLVGEWEFPGGKIEKGETPFQAIEREIKEELGIKVCAREKINDFQHEYEFGIVELTLIRCEALDDYQNICLDGSHSKITFINPLDKLNLSLAPLDQKIIAFLRS